MVVSTAARVPSHTSHRSNEQIQRKTEMNIAYFQRHPEQIPRRLVELDREWDIERVLETASATMTLAGLMLSVFKDRKWILLSVAVQGFFMQHALQGWCPPLPLMRSLGVRTADEINEERYTLRAMWQRWADGAQGEEVRA
jgi:hypothetical protein